MNSFKRKSFLCISHILVGIAGIVVWSLPAFAETSDLDHQPIFSDEYQQQQNLEGTDSGENSGLSENRGDIDPLNETIPGDLGEEESSSMAEDGSILPGENAEQFKEDDQEPREREGFLRTLPGGLN